MPSDRILVLAGTTEARALANALVTEGHDLVTSFAGVTREPLLPKGRIHIGGFGGVQGLVDFMRAEAIAHVIDATHPFAAQMSAHAATACVQMSVPLLRLERPAWRMEKGDAWLSAANMEEAVARIPGGSRVLVTTGRKGLASLLTRQDLSGAIRTIEPPAVALPATWQLLLDRPPHAVAAELDLITRERITCLLSKNAGGETTSAKLAAARQSGITVVMIERPAKPPCPTVPTVDEALLGIRRQAG